MIPNLDGKQRVLVAVLHWGLGHATRCIPIIDHLLSKGKIVAIAGDSESLKFLKRRYPKLKSFDLPSYNITYDNDHMAWSMAKQLPKIYRTYKREYKVTQGIVNEWKPDTIISDNRFGVRSDYTYNIYLTHQLNILHHNATIAKLANVIHRRFIHTYDECWIPDDSQQTLSGILSNNSLVNTPCTYIGALTRLNVIPVKEYIQYLIILSGPEPARSNLETEIVNIVSESINSSVVLVRGTTKKSLITFPTNMVKYDIVDSKELESLINQSACIISRAGYSTIMDLQNFTRPKYYIPTPGQTEQLYLAKFHHGKNHAIYLKDHIELKEIIIQNIR